MTSEPMESAAPTIDCDVHNGVPSIDALYPYLSGHWRDYIVERGITSLETNYYPRGLSFSARPKSWPPSGGPPASDPKLIHQDVLDAQGSQYAILNCLYGVQQIHNEDWAVEMSAALNSWQAQYWLEGDPRLRASIVVQTQNPVRAAEEIERWANHPGFVQVLLMVRSGMPYGKRYYWPVYAAAEAAGMPVGIHTGGTSVNPITPAGWPSYYIEDYASAAQAFQTQLVSLVCEGVFSKFPHLKVVLIESGLSWLPSLMWRLDKNWKGLRREVPWVDRPPSEVIREHCYFTIQPFDAPSHPDVVRRIVEHIGSEDVLLFASDYPHWHAHDPIASCVSYLDAGTQRKVLYDNGLALYGLG